MSNYRPPTYQPSQEGTDIFPDVSPTPMAIQYTIEASKQWLSKTTDPGQVADQILDYYSTNVSQLVQSGRQQHDQGVAPVTQKHLDMVGIRVVYLNQNHLETLRITILPESIGLETLATATDLNFDGYIAWVHHWHQATVGPNSIPYDLILNGTKVLENFFPPDSFLATHTAGDITSVTASLCVIIAFGPTALRAQSLHDKQNPFAKQVNGGLMPKVEPARKDIPDATGSFGGPIPKHKDLLGYFMFGPQTRPTGWADPYNPSDYAYNGDVLVLSGIWDENHTYDDSGYAPVQVARVVQFAEPENSPLVNVGKNVFAVQPNPAGLVSGGEALKTASISAAQAAIARDQAAMLKYPVDAGDEVTNTHIAATTYPVTYLIDLDNQALAALGLAPDWGAALVAQQILVNLIQNDIEQAAADAEGFFQAAQAQYSLGHIAAGDALMAQYTQAHAVDPYLKNAKKAASLAVDDATFASRLAIDEAALTTAMNTTDAQWQAAAAETGLIEGQLDTLCAEFYDRSDIRSATVSWKFPSGAPGGGVVAVTDKPVYWNCGVNPVALAHLDFDLTRKHLDPTPNTLGERSTIVAKTTPVGSGKPLATYTYRVIEVRGDQMSFGPYHHGSK